ncbi:hypothetical protein PT300_10885 [Enterobacteriaceae bacterium ESL0689]|nr:hypothetical protein [Enterobacteriaceae bacterium ESL0689]
MRVIKLVFFALPGITCFLAFWFAVYPSVCGILVGPVMGEDQMSKNFWILFFGTPLMAIAGGVVGWRTGGLLQVFLLVILNFCFVMVT